MMRRLLLLLSCLVLLSSCATSTPTLRGVERVDGRMQFPIGLRELLRLSRHATLDELEARIGLPPSESTFVTVRGPFETPDGFWIESVFFHDAEQGNIDLKVNSGNLGACFPMREIAALPGVQRSNSAHAPPNSYTLGTDNLSIFFDPACHSDVCLGSINFAGRGESPRPTEGS